MDQQIRRSRYPDPRTARTMLNRRQKNESHSRRPNRLTRWLSRRRCIGRKTSSGSAEKITSVYYADMTCSSVLGGRDIFPIHTDMQENMWARLRDSRPGARAIHATQSFPHRCLPHSVTLSTQLTLRESCSMRRNFLSGDREYPSKLYRL